MAANAERRELQQRFAALPAAERRAIVRAVNRGQPVDIRKYAPLAVNVARRQMRFWKWSWLIGPAVGVIQIGQLGAMAALLNALVAASLLGAMSTFFWARARRSEHANLALMDRSRPAPRQSASPRQAHQSHPDPAPARGLRRWFRRDRQPVYTGDPEPSGHLPGEERREPRSPQHSDRELPADRRPYQPRGRKRRGRG